MKNPFNNDPFIIVHQAFSKLFPGKEYTCQWHDDLRSIEGESVLGLTDFSDSDIPQVFVSYQLTVFDSVEVFAHELAHVGVGIDHEHDDEWKKAFDAIFQEYHRIIGIDPADIPKDSLPPRNEAAEWKKKFDALYEDMRSVIKKCDEGCKLCIHNHVCQEENCPKFEKGVGAVGEDGTEHPDFKWTCMDFDWGTCPMLENTPCKDCDFQNHWEWRGPQKGEANENS